MKPRVLIVENSRALIDLLINRLQDSGKYSVDIARNYQEARALLSSEDNTYFVALVGYSLPGCQDGEIIDYVISKKISTIVFTAKFDQEVREQILAKPIVDYVQKNAPHKIDYLCSLITQLHENSNTKVLVVDDSESVRYMVCSLLKVYHYQVVEASSGAEALEVLNNNADIRLLITDYTMPEMDGLELVSKVREKFTKDRLAIIGISSSADQLLSAKFLKCGASDLIMKPFVKEEFYSRVSQNIEMLRNIDALREARDEAQRATELKDKFVSLVSHDLRSPFSSMLSYMEMMLNDEDTDGEELSKKHRRMISSLLQTGRGLVGLVEELLDVSRFKTGQLILRKGFFNSSQLISDVLRQFKLQAEEKGVVLKSVLPENLRTFADKDLYRQVIQNLVANAIKFSNKGNTVTIASVGSESGTIVVRDQGVGISEDKIEAIFSYEEDTSTKGTLGEKGTGLGLPLCHDIVRAHGGNIRVKSRLGEGTAFYVSIPVCIPEVLLIDDSKSVCEQMRRLLALLDVNVIEVDDGGQAIDYLNKQDFHLVVCDVDMSRTQGIEVLKKLKDTPAIKEIPVVVLTGDQKPETRDRVLRLGADDFISKPIDAYDLMPRIRKILS